MGWFNDIKKQLGLEDWTWSEIVNESKKYDYDNPGFKLVDWGKDTINAITGKSNIDETRRANEENASLSRENIEMQEKYNNEQIRLAEEAAAFEKEKFEYDKYLNANQNQIAANDRSAAGLNPIGQANLSTVSVGGLPESINGSAPQHTNNVVAGMFDTSIMTQAAKSAFDIWSAKKNNKLAGESLNLAKDELNFKKESNKTQMDINQAEADIAKYTAITDRVNTIVTMAKAGFSTRFINKSLNLEEPLSDKDIERLINTWDIGDKNIEADTANKGAEKNDTEIKTGLNKQLFDAQNVAGAPVDFFKLSDGRNIYASSAIEAVKSDSNAKKRKYQYADSEEDLQAMDNIYETKTKYGISNRNFEKAKDYAIKQKSYKYYQVMTKKENEIPEHLYEMMLKVYKGKKK